MIVTAYPNVPTRKRIPTSITPLGGTDPITLSVTQGGNTAQFILYHKHVLHGGCAITPPKINKYIYNRAISWERRASY